MDITTLALSKGYTNDLLDTKQDKLIAGNGIDIASDGKTISLGEINVSVSMNFDETNGCIYLAGSSIEETAQLYDGIIDFGDNVAWIPLDDFNENTSVLVVYEDIEGESGNLISTASVKSGASGEPALNVWYQSEEKMSYIRNNISGITANEQTLNYWNAALVFPFKNLILGNKSIRNTSVTNNLDNESDYSSGNSVAIQNFNNFIALNMSSNKTAENELTTYNTNSLLNSLKNSGAISSNFSTFKISCFKVWKNKTFSSISAAMSSTETPDIWLRVTADGQVVNAGTSGNIVYSGVKSAIINE